MVPRGLTVVNYRFLEMVSRKGTLLINMISIASAIKLYSFNISGGTGSMPVLTCGFGYETVFPFSDPRLVPYISSAANMPAQLIRHTFKCWIATSINCQTTSLHDYVLEMRGCLGPLHHLIGIFV